MKKKITKIPGEALRVLKKNKKTIAPDEKPDYKFITPWAISDKKTVNKKKKKTLSESKDIFYHFG